MWKTGEVRRTAAAELCQTHEHINAITRDVTVSNTDADGNRNQTRNSICLQIVAFIFW